MNKRGLITLLACLFLFGSVARAQNDTLLQLDFTNEQREVKDFKKLGNHGFIFSGTSYTSDEAYHYDLINGTIDSVAPDVSGYKDLLYNSSGLFFYGGGGLNYYDTLTNRMNPVAIGNTAHNGTHRARPVLCDDRYYVNAYQDNDFYLWESDGTEQGTQIIYQSNNPISYLDQRNDTLLIVEDLGSDYQFMYYTFGAVPNVFATISKDDHINYFSNGGSSESHIYYYGRDTSGLDGIYQIDFTSGPSFFLSGTGSLNFDGQSFLLESGFSASGFGGSRYLISGNLQNLAQLDTIRFKKEIESTPSVNGPSAFLTQRFNGGYYRMSSHKQGYEIIRVNNEDSLDLLSSQNPGPSSSLLMKSMYISSFASFEGYYDPENDRTYFLLSNGNDPYYYIYQLEGENTTSIVKIGEAEKFAAVIAQANYIYWIENDEGHAKLIRRDLSVPNEVQPDSQPKSEVWYRQIGLGYGISPTIAGSVFLYTQDVEFDDAGNVIVGFNTNRNWSETSQVYGDTNIVTQHPGIQYVVKYNAYGELMWSNGIGDDHGVYFRDSEFAVRPNGNVIVVGQFSDKGYFGNDSLETSQAGFYMVELDGNSGDVLWKRLLGEESYVNKLYPEGVTVDEEGNIYLAFLFRGFDVTFANVPLNAQVSPVNALGKFDASGNVIWVQTTPTPWTDDYGLTHVLDYSEDYQTVTMITSQGRYNAGSSCEFTDWRYYIQEYTPDGDLMNTKDFFGSDLGAVTVGTRTENNTMFGLGYFRSQLNTGNITLNTQPQNACYRNEMFAVEYYGSQQQIIAAGNTQNNTIFPLDIAKTDKHIYVYGLSEDDTLTALKYDLSGNYIGYKKLNQTKWDGPDLWITDFFDANEDYLVFSGLDWKKATVIDWRPDFATVKNVSLLKIPNADWRTDQEFIVYENADLPGSSEEFLVYPNPFEDEITLILESLDENYSTYTIVDNMGREVQSGSLNGELIQKIQLVYMSSGMYNFILRSENASVSTPLLKL